jgi:SAM-dependent methyltransferase
MRGRKASGLVSQFLQQQYGIGWRDISSKMRATLLEEVEHVPCNLCGRDEQQTVATRDKYRLPLNTVICRGCGLLYLNPRPTAAIYQRFYEQGGQENSIYHRRIDFSCIDDLLKFYYGPDFAMDERARKAMAKFMADQGIGEDGKSLSSSVAQPPSGQGDENAQGKEAERSGDDDETCGEEVGLDVGAERINYYAQHLYDELKDLVPVGGKVFEPGASWGKMLQPWKELHRCEATGVEPKKEAVRLAKEVFGIDLLQGFADDPRIPENTYDLVFNTRTINHMLDPLGDLRNAWRWLKPGGVLLVDIADAIKEAQYEGFERNVVEIDHPYMFSLNTLKTMVQKAGFTIIKQEITDLQQVRDWDNRPPQSKQIRITARKSTDSVVVDWPDPLAELSALLQAQLEFDRTQAELGKNLNESHSRLKARYRTLKTAYTSLETETATLRRIAKLPKTLSSMWSRAGKSSGKTRTTRSTRPG